MGKDRSAPRARWVVLVAAAVAFEVVAVLKPGTPRSLAVTVDVLLGLAGATAWAATARRARAERAELRQAWGWLSTGCLVFAAGQLTFALQTAADGLHPAQGGTVADILTGASIPLAAAGLVRFAGPSLTSRLVTALDAATVTAALLFVSWAVVLGPVYRTEGTSTQRITTLGYVGGSLALLALVLVLTMRWRADSHALLLLAVAFALLTTTNAAYGVTSLRGRYSPGDWRIDIGWFGAFLLIAGATWGHGREGVDVRSRWWLTLFVPYGAVLLAVVTGSGLLATGHDFDVFLEVDGTAILWLVLGRQVVTLRVQHGLTVQLERLVAERTASAHRYAAQLRALLRDSSDVIAVVDDHADFVYVSPASWSLFELPAEDLVGTSLLDYVHPDDRPATLAALAAARVEGEGARTTFRLRSVGDHWSAVEASLSPAKDDPLGSGVVLNIRDISERAAEQEQLRRLALHDPLTSLANRRAFDDRVRHALDRAQRTEEPVSVLFVDLDHFKQVNDTAGHATGDLLLVEAAQRLRSCLRPADTAARIGGDEFAVLLEDTTPEQASEVAARVVEALAPPYRLGGRTISVTASVGVTSVRGGAVAPPDLVADADVAMYRAKARGRARVEVYDPGTADPPAPDQP